MTVYVDSMRAKFGRMVMCHMIADTHDELVEMADTIGVDWKWIQFPRTDREHFDIALGKRDRAIKAGAVVIERDKLAAWFRSMRDPLFRTHYYMHAEDWSASVPEGS